jgi:hypothetical protein
MISRGLSRDQSVLLFLDLAACGSPLGVDDLAGLEYIRRFMLHCKIDAFNTEMVRAVESGRVPERRMPRAYFPYINMVVCKNRDADD